MGECETFLTMLQENEDDVTTRLVYADWLDDHGEHEEADRHRKWPAAKVWMAAFAKEHCLPRNWTGVADDGTTLTPIEPLFDPANTHEYPPSNYRELIDAATYSVHATAAAGQFDIGFNTGMNLGLRDALEDNAREFWKNWSVLTGIRLTQAALDNSEFTCCPWNA